MKSRFSVRKLIMLLPVLLCLLLSGCESGSPGQPAGETALPSPAEALSAPETELLPADALPPEETELPSPAEMPAGEGAADGEPLTEIRVLLDEHPWSGDPAAGVSEDDLTVYVTHGGELLISLPFSENHVVTVQQPDGSENTVMLTGSMVRMMHANCSNQDCVGMGEVTRENLQDRILGGFIVCLPHEIIIEVREP